MMWHAADGMGWWLVWGGLMMVVFWAAIIGLVAWAIQGSAQQGGAHRRSSSTSSTRRSPLDIAQHRYAEGEIDRDEFEQLREDLEGHSRSLPGSSIAEAGNTAPSATR